MLLCCCVAFEYLAGETVSTLVQLHLVRLAQLIQHINNAMLFLRLLASLVLLVSAVLADNYAALQRPLQVPPPYRSHKIAIIGQ
jgi:hypothetical protein